MLVNQCSIIVRNWKKCCGSADADTLIYCIEMNCRVVQDFLFVEPDAIRVRYTLTSNLGCKFCKIRSLDHPSHPPSFLEAMQDIHTFEIQDCSLYCCMRAASSERTQAELSCG